MATIVHQWAYRNSGVYARNEEPYADNVQLYGSTPIADTGLGKDQALLEGQPTRSKAPPPKPRQKQKLLGCDAGP